MSYHQRNVLVGGCVVLVQFALLRYIDLGLPGVVGTIIAGVLAYVGARAVLVLCGMSMGTLWTLRSIARGSKLAQVCVCGAELPLSPLPPLPFDLYAHIATVAKEHAWMSFDGPVGEDAYCCPECAAKLRGPSSA